MVVTACSVDASGEIETETKPEKLVECESKYEDACRRIWMEARWGVLPACKGTPYREMATGTEFRDRPVAMDYDGKITPKTGCIPTNPGRVDELTCCR